VRSPLLTTSTHREHGVARFRCAGCAREHLVKEVLLALSYDAIA
jgi:hypothetical protein